MDLSKLEWTCHICKTRRSDAQISVFSKDDSEAYGLPKGHAIQNIRYCNDNPDCTEKAKTYNHVDPKKLMGK